MTIKLAVFDCDGTLVDGQAAVCDAMEKGFASVGLPAPPRSETRRIVGLSLPAAIRRLAPESPEETHAMIVDAYKRAFFDARQAGRVDEPLFDGIRPLLDALRNNGWMLGVATGKSRRGLLNCLTNHGLLDHFSTLQTADDHPSKPHPSMLEEAMGEVFSRPKDTVMIGDTAFDVEMARSAGVRALGVAWGYHSKKELVGAGANAVAENPLHLGRLLA